MSWTPASPTCPPKYYKLLSNVAPNPELTDSRITLTNSNTPSSAKLVIKNDIGFTFSFILKGLVSATLNTQAVMRVRVCGEEIVFADSLKWFLF